MRIQKIISGRWSVLVTTLLSLAICAPAALAHTLSFTETDYAAGQTSLGQSLAVGDFNHNGISDIAMIDVPTCYPLPPAQECTGTVSVRLGRKGNRTFTPGIEVALGNGDGTFQAPEVGAIGVSGVLAVGEFDHDGVPDLVATGGGAGTAHVNVLLGNGDGTFQSPQAFDVGGPPTWVVAADLKNRGRRGPDDVVVAIPSGVAVVVNKHHGDIDKPRYTFESFDALSGARETIALDADGQGLGFPGVHCKC